MKQKRWMGATLGVLLLVSTPALAQSGGAQRDREAHYSPAAAAASPGIGMMGSFQDPKTAAKMLEMDAEMMRSNAAIMEKFAKQLEKPK